MKIGYRKNHELTKEEKYESLNDYISGVKSAIEQDILPPVPPFWLNEGIPSGSLSFYDESKVLSLEEYKDWEEALTKKLK